jgi:two-component system, NarL family, response regulator
MSETRQTDSTSAAKIRVLLIDDHPVVRHGLASMIDDEPDMTVVAQAGDAAQALARYREVMPDVALVDLGLPGMDGVEVISRLRAEHPQGRFIVLTTLDGDEHIFRAMRAGAQAYVLKDMACGEITDAIRLVHAGQRLLPSPVAEKLEARGAALTAREIEVLALIARGESNKIIGATLGVAEGTIKAHVFSIFHKLQVDDRTAAVTLALRRGIIKL